MLQVGTPSIESRLSGNSRRECAVYMKGYRLSVKKGTFFLCGSCLYISRIPRSSDTSPITSIDKCPDTYV